MNAGAFCTAMTQRLFPQSMRTLAWRRVYVVLAYALAAATVAVAWAGEPAVTVIVGITASSFFGLYWAAIQGLTDRPDSGVDEREKALRDGAHRIAFQTLAWSVLPVVLVGAYFFPDGSGIIELVWALTATQMAVWGMPGAIVAWTQPDEVE